MLNEYICSNSEFLSSWQLILHAAKMKKDMIYLLNSPQCSHYLCEELSMMTFLFYVHRCWLLINILAWLLFIYISVLCSGSLYHIFNSGFNIQSVVRYLALSFFINFEGSSPFYWILNILYSFIRKSYYKIFGC